MVPKKFQQDILFHLHNILQPGWLAPAALFHLGMSGVALLRTWKPGPSPDPACTASRARSSATPGHRPLHIPISQRRFSHINIDLVGSLQLSNKCNLIFTIIDRTSKWMEAIPLAAIAAADCAWSLVCHWITHFGVPATTTSDQGQQLTSHMWDAL
jgi:hypothetical protein